ncbi:MAG TPA: response regulator [Thermoflexia bacterium]|nr:response regulator [Thermoflexia bacterium]
MGSDMPQETILIVEDDPEIRAFLREVVLEPRRYRVLMETDGRRGMEQVLREKPDLLLLDLRLPHLQGLDLLRRLKQLGHQIPTIVLTVHASEETILEAFRLGAKDFLPKPFSAEEARAAIENALTEERLRREKERLTRALLLANRRLQRQIQNWVALHDIAQAITSTLDETEIYHRVMVNVNRILRVEAGSLLLLNPETKELEFRMTLHGDTARFADIRLKLGQGIAGWVAQHGRPLLVPDVRKDPRFYAQVDRALGFHTRSVLCVPLKARGEVIGVLEVINKLDGPESPAFTRGDLELLGMLASWVSVAVENARLNRSMQETVALRTLKQVVVTVAHHVNNRLMNLSLELDRLEGQREPSPDQIRTTIESARRWIQEIANVVRALDRVGEIRTVPYVGNIEMLDLESVLDSSR